MHQTNPDHERPAPRDPDEHGKPQLLSHSDPSPDTASNRSIVLLVVVIVLLVIGFVVLHLTGVVGPGSH